MQNRNKRKRVGYLFTSESVSKGHPDKVADAISDAILDAAIAQDPTSRVACECFVTTDTCIIGGEITTKANLNYEEIVRGVIKDIGYTEKGKGSDCDCEIISRIHTQSPDIAMGVDRDGAGDQGMMFGGACIETEDLMPLPLSMARALTDKVTEIYSLGEGIFYPDAKSQVTVNYDRDNKPIRIDTVVVSVQHSPDIALEVLRKKVKSQVIAPVLSTFGFSLEDVANVHINPTGRFVEGGPSADTGLTGRKIIVDTYGGYFSHGGGAFSGKDPTKVDRSGAYMARYIAKNIVAGGLADKVEIQLAYAIGITKPVSVNIKTFGSNKYPISLIAKSVYQYFDMTPKGIISTLGLTSGGFKYQDLAQRGHFGETVKDLPWEQIDKAQSLSMFCAENFIPKNAF